MTLKNNSCRNSLILITTKILSLNNNNHILLIMVYNKEYNNNLNNNMVERFRPVLNNTKELLNMEDNRIIRQEASQDFKETLKDFREDLKYINRITLDSTLKEFLNLR